MKNFDFTEILERIRVTTGKEEAMKTNDDFDYEFIEEENVKYKVTREDKLKINTSVRYCDSKFELATHLRNIGYSDYYILREIDKLHTTINLITDEPLINYTIETIEIMVEEKLNKRAWLIDVASLKGNVSDGLEYYIDEDKNVYRYTKSLNKLRKISKPENPKVRVGTSYDIKIDSIWDKYRLNEIEGGI